MEISRGNNHHFPDEDIWMRSETDLQRQRNELPQTNKSCPLVHLACTLLDIWGNTSLYPVDKRAAVTGEGLSLAHSLMYQPSGWPHYHLDDVITCNAGSSTALTTPLQPPGRSLHQVRKRGSFRPFRHGSYQLSQNPHKRKSFPALNKGRSLSGYQPLSSG